MFKTLQNIWNGMLHFVYPQLCVACNRALIEQEKSLCLECANNLPLTKYHHIPDNETAQRFAGRIRFKHASSFAYFTKDGILQELLHELKYKNNKEAGTLLAKRFAITLKKTDWIKEIDLIIPVPLHPKKQNQRGFNQSELLANIMAQELGIPVQNTSLKRVVNTDSQTHKSRAERAQNMDGAFKVEDPINLSSKHILLLDDVLTTGATIEACVKALQSVKDLRVSIITLGIAID